MRQYVNYIFLDIRCFDKCEMYKLQGRDKSRPCTVFMNMFLSRNPGHRHFQPQKQDLTPESGFMALKELLGLFFDNGPDFIKTRFGICFKAHHQHILRI